MSNLTLAQINAAMDAAFQTALAQPQRVAPQIIGDNATLRTDIYSGPKGTGFVVATTINLQFRTLVIARQHGPETWREEASPTLEDIVTECQERRAARYEAEASVYDLADAETKLASPDAAIQAEGSAQRETVLAKRLAIKTEIPKPQ